MKTEEVLWDREDEDYFYDKWLSQYYWELFLNQLNNECIKGA